jgi:hypothetical protein
LFLLEEPELDLTVVLSPLLLDDAAELFLVPEELCDDLTVALLELVCGAVLFTS